MEKANNTPDAITKVLIKRSSKTTAKLIRTTCIVFHNNISAGHTNLLQVYRCYTVPCKPEAGGYGQPKYC